MLSTKKPKTATKSFNSIDKNLEGEHRLNPCHLEETKSNSPEIFHVDSIAKCSGSSNKKMIKAGTVLANF